MKPILPSRSTRLLSFLVAFLAFSMLGMAQLTPFEVWVNNTGSQNFFIHSKTVTDAGNNVYVAGATINGSGNYDIIVTKYNSTGTHLWTQQVDGLANYHDAATALFVDGSGNVYITGFIIDTLAHGSDAYTAKFNSSGTLQWSARYNGTGDFHDTGSDIIVDGSGNVYITGARYNTVPNTDILTIKYNSSGTQQWASFFNSTYNMNDFGGKVSISGTTGRILVTGGLQIGVSSYAYGVMTYNQTTGAQIGGSVSGTGSSNIIEVTALAKDALGNCYLAGTVDAGGGNGLDYCVMKIDTNAAILWERSYNGAANLADVAKDVTVDANGNVYVTGFSTTSTQSTNYTTVKYNSSGTQVWVQHFNGAANGADTAKALIIHNDTTLVVTGTSFNGSSFDYHTIKYDTTGALLWEISYNGIDNLNDMAHDMAIDSLGAIVVTGQSQTPTSLNYTTLKYVDPYITKNIPDTMPLGQSLSFIENRGQLINTDGDSMPGIRYYNHQDYYSKYFTDTCISFVFSKIDTSATTDDTLHRVDMRFVNQLTSARVGAMEIRSNYDNFYLPQTAPNGLARVPHYNKLYMHDLWEEIDLHISSNPAGVKYAFIFNPGYSNRDFKLLFEGHDDISIDGNGALVLETILGNIILPQVKAFQIDDNGDQVPLAWQPDYYIDGDEVYLDNIGGYDTDLRLVFVIENDYTNHSPQTTGLCWSTYFGGTGDDWTNALDIDDVDNQYITGVTASTELTFPIIPGAAFDENLGNYVSFYSKFDVLNQLAYSTFFGGTDLTESFDIKVKNQNEIIISGMTLSSDLPVYDPGGNVYYDGVLNQGLGGYDGFIAQFDIDGYRIWATYFGGEYVDKIYAHEFDASGNLYITGHGGGTNFPTVTLSGAYNDNTPTNTDAFIAKFDANYELVWSTFLGGNSTDESHAIHIDVNNNVYLTGHTQSNDFPTQNPGGLAYFDNSLNGTSDYFITKFSSAGALIWSTYIGGDGDELFSTNVNANVITTDGFNHLYLVGYTTSGTNFPLFDPGGTSFYDGTYSNSPSYDGFLLQFDLTNFELLWGTYISEDGATFLKSVIVDVYGNLFIGGSTGDAGFSLVQLPNVYFQNVLNGGIAPVVNPYDEAFLICINPFREIKWSTYFGGYNDHSYGDWINDMCLNSSNNLLFFAGHTAAQSNPGFQEFPFFDPGSGAYFDDEYNGSFRDAFIAKFCLENITEINEWNTSENVFNLYPNPSSNTITLEFTGINSDTETNIVIYDLNGKEVYNALHVNNGQITINVNAFSSGMYFLRASKEDLLLGSQKFIRQ